MRKTIIRINPYGRLANRMGQLMFAESVKRGCWQPVAVEGYSIPDWGLSAPMTGGPSSNIMVESYLTRSVLCSAMIDVFRPRLINVTTPIFRVGNYGKPENYFPIFPTGEPAVRVSDDYLLVHIRSGDVATPIHWQYGPLPIRYYEYLFAQTGLRPLFIGELARTPYIDLLKATFPKAEWIGGGSAIDDFQTIRSAQNVALSVSSFAWMATFLSIKAQRIHLPLVGHFDIATDPYSDFLPVDDSRYVFHEVSREGWVKRYEDPVGPRDGFSIARRASIRALKTVAVLRTAKQSLIIHGRLLRRMAGFAGLTHKTD